MGDSNITSFIKIGILTTFLICTSVLSHAQKFDGGVVFGLNLAQIDGDELAGFSKLGLTGGVKLAYPIEDNIDMNLEMLYSQRGSNSGFGFGSITDNYVDLQYLEIPIYVNIQDWYQEKEDYHKAKAHIGLNYSYLFAVESSNGNVSNDIDTYKRNNIGFIIGADYSFTKNLGITIRYTRAFNSITDNRAISYYWTIRTEFMF